MRTRAALAALLTPLVTFAALGAGLAACDDGDVGLDPSANATVSFVNVTGRDTIAVANAGTTGAGNGNLSFGGTSTCMTVAPGNAGALTFQKVSVSGTGSSAVTTRTDIPGYSSSFQRGGRYTVIAYRDAAGATQFATLDNSYTPASGSAGLRIFNAAAGSGSVVANSGTTALGGGTGVAFGTAGSFFDMPAGAQTITFNTGAGTSTVATTAALSFVAGQNYTLIVAPAASGSSTLRTVFVAGC